MAYKQITMLGIAGGCMTRHPFTLRVTGINALRAPVQSAGVRAPVARSGRGRSH